MWCELGLSVVSSIVFSLCFQNMSGQGLLLYWLYVVSDLNHTPGKLLDSLSRRAATLLNTELLSHRS